MRININSSVFCLFVGVLATTRAADEVTPSASERFASAETAEVPDFQQHVVPLLGRLGCNGRACHGSFQGRGGFRLSLFGYDFPMDHASLTEGEDPRVDLKTPAESQARAFSVTRYMDRCFLWGEMRERPLPSSGAKYPTFR